MPADEGHGTEHDFSAPINRVKADEVKAYENHGATDQSLLSMHIDKLISESQPIPLIVFDPLTSKCS
jgi:hypothetical protein